jgi:2'-5' RNA ligase
MSGHDEVQRIYDRLWSGAVDRLARGEVEIDRHLSDIEADRRFGITLIVRPSPEVAGHFIEFQAQMRELEPEQYFYAPSDFHVTVLTLVRAAEGFDLGKVPIGVYDQVFRGLFPRFNPFPIRFHGISATAESVLVQGYVDDDDLNAIRDAVRWELARVNLAHLLDVRYRVVAAHSTVMRFRAPLRDPARLLAALSAARDRDFGTGAVDRVYFVVNDWYMSYRRLRVLAEYPLSRRPGFSPDRGVV